MWWLRLKAIICGEGALWAKKAGNWPDTGTHVEARTPCVDLKRTPCLPPNRRSKRTIANWTENLGWQNKKWLFCPINQTWEDPLLVKHTPPNRLLLWLLKKELTKKCTETKTDLTKYKNYLFCLVNTKGAEPSVRQTQTKVSDAIHNWHSFIFCLSYFVGGWGALASAAEAERNDVCRLKLEAGCR